ncbi:hypothetical protein ACFSUS_01420 [Spirosoma soli]|uniref:Uncharacterized protein n=1 Tax=Spirosoma soli TaxID=1770529 RepID=A0ABW5M0X4_9BACT
MNNRQSLSRWKLLTRAGLLLILNGLTFVVVNALMPSFRPAFPTIPAGEAAQLPVFLLVYLLIRTAVLVYLIRHLSSPTYGSAVWLALILFGLETVLMQLETIWFRSAFPALSYRNVGIFLMSSLLEKAIIVPIAVWLLRPKTSQTTSTQPFTPGVIGWHRSWLLLALVYVCIYFLLGYLIAWQSPSLRQFYTGSTRLDGFLTHMLDVDPWLILFQYGRGLGWLVLASLLSHLFTNHRKLFQISIVLIGAVLIPGALLLPNPLMPEPVRYAHLWELVSSGTLWGWLLGRYVHVKQMG